MIELTLDGMELPEARKGAYRAWREDLGVEVTMVSGRMVKEIRGTVWRVSYQYGYFNDAERTRLIESCRKGRIQPIVCAFLPPDADELISREFFVTSFTEPKFMWSNDEKPLWGDFAVELREVKPSD